MAFETTPTKTTFLWKFSVVPSKPRRGGKLDVLFATGLKFYITLHDHVSGRRACQNICLKTLLKASSSTLR